MALSLVWWMIVDGIIVTLSIVDFTKDSLKYLAVDWPLHKLVHHGGDGWVQHKGNQEQEGRDGHDGQCS